MATRKKKKTWIYVLIGAIIVLLVLAVVKGRSDKGIAVTTEKAEKRTIIETVSASGKIAPEVEVIISSAVSGEIVELPVEEGQRVKKGDLLVRINPDLAQAALDRAIAGVNNARANEAAAQARLVQAEAQYRNAKLNFDRNKQLFDSGAISQAEFDNIEASYLGARAEVDAAKQNAKAAEYQILSASASQKEAANSYLRTTLYSPMDGAVSLLNMELGEQVVGTAQMTGTEIMRIANLEVMQVEVDVNESDIVKVSVGDTALIEVDAYLNRKFKGIVTRMASSASNLGMSTDQVTNFLVRIRILESSYADLIEGDSLMQSPFRPGMNANVDIQTRTEFNVLTVPVGAVTTRTDTTSGVGGVRRFTTNVSVDEEPIECVFVFNNGKAEIRPVTSGIQDNQHITILSGIEEGEEIITGPYDVVSTKLFPGDVVTKQRAGEEGERRGRP